jgi:hypothetical protein
MISGPCLITRQLAVLTLKRMSGSWSYSGKVLDVLPRLIAKEDYFEPQDTAPDRFALLLVTCWHALMHLIAETRGAELFWIQESWLLSKSGLWPQ